MANAQDINVAFSTSPREVSGSWSNNYSNSQFLSTSPVAAFHSPASASYGAAGRLAASGAPALKVLKPFNTKDIKILLLENVNKTGQDILKAQGYQVEALKTSLPEDQLIDRIK